MSTGTDDSVSTDPFAEMRDAFGQLAEAQVEDTTPETTDDGDPMAVDGTTPSDSPESPEAATLATETASETAKPDETDETAPSGSDETTEAPFTYTVDGQVKAFEGASVVSTKDGTILGVTIPAARMEHLQTRLGRADRTEQQNRELYRQVQAFESLGGTKQLETLTTENAKLVAAVQLLAKTIEDPQALVELVTDQTGLSLARLQRELGLAVKESEYTTREKWGQQVKQHETRESQAADAKAQTTQAITGAIGHWAQQFPALTEADRTAAEAHFQKVGSAVVRPATAEEAQANPELKPGQLVIDHGVIYAWLQDRAQLRQEQQERVKTTAATVQKAQAENATKLAAAKVGTTPAKSSGKRSGATPPQTKKHDGPTYEEIKRAALAGRFVDDGSDDE